MNIVEIIASQKTTNILLNVIDTMRLLISILFIYLVVNNVEIMNTMVEIPIGMLLVMMGVFMLRTTDFRNYMIRCGDKE